MSVFHEGIIEVDDEEECTIVYDGEILLDE